RSTCPPAERDRTIFPLDSCWSTSRCCLRGSSRLSVCQPAHANATTPLAANTVSSKLHDGVLLFLWTMSESPQVARLTDAARCNLHRSVLQTPAACAILTCRCSQIDLASRLHIVRRQVESIRSRCRPSDMSKSAILSTTRQRSTRSNFTAHYCSSTFQG
ncbi:hypothetical protein CORC01_10088, partial [Colletotrichum orchidophilum]